MSQRVRSLVSYVRPRSIVYDLCCDHGLIGLAAWDRGDIEGLVFVDQSVEALHALRRVLQERQLEKNARIEVRVAHAESIITPLAAADFIIAGVGIQTIVGIIKKLFPLGLGIHRLILGPQQKSQGLREFLISRSFGLVQEDVVWEAGRFRELIVLESEGEAVSIYGDRFERSKEPLALEFAAYLKNYYRAIAERQLQSRSLSNSQNP